MHACPVHSIILDGCLGALCQRKTTMDVLEGEKEYLLMQRQLVIVKAVLREEKPWHCKGDRRE